MTDYANVLQQGLHLENKLLHFPHTKREEKAKKQT